jgi:hypothetical protein
MAASLLASALAGQQPAPTWEDLERQGAHFDSIELCIGDVFDPTRPHEDHWLGRVVNFLHIQTREQVVRREIPFRKGDPVNARLVHEAERVLRSFRFLKDAIIEPRVDAAGAVHAVVRTQDAWTLKASVGASQVGNQRSVGFAVHEANLLGFGKDLTLSHEKTTERSTDTLLYADRQFLGSDWTLTSRYQVLSDGKTRLLDLTRPYHQLDTPWSLSFTVASSDSVETLYNHQFSAYTYSARREGFSLGGSWATSITGDRAIRVGGGLDLSQARFSNLQALDAGLLGRPILMDRNLRGLHGSWSLFEDRFRPYRDLAGMTHTEDYNLGWEAQVSLGVYLQSLGSDVNAPFIRASAAKGWAPGSATLLLFRGQASARREASGWQDGLLNSTFTAYYHGFSRQTQAAYLQLDAVRRPDPQNLLYLGGLDGLRGYGNHMWVGDRRWLASVEERVITPVNWLGLLHLGFVAYADAGALHRLDTGLWSRTYVDVGGGLRLGNLKSSIGRVFMMTVAYPLVKDPWTDRYQIVVGDLVRF